MSHALQNRLQSLLQSNGLQLVFAPVSLRLFASCFSHDTNVVDKLEEALRLMVVECGLSEVADHGLLSGEFLGLAALELGVQIKRYNFIRDEIEEMTALNQSEQLFGGFVYVHGPAKGGPYMYLFIKPREHQSVCVVELGLREATNILASVKSGNRRYQTNMGVAGSIPSEISLKSHQRVFIKLPNGLSSNDAKMMEKIASVFGLTVDANPLLGHNTHPEAAAVNIILNAALANKIVAMGGTSKVHEIGGSNLRCSGESASYSLIDGGPRDQNRNRMLGLRVTTKVLEADSVGTLYNARLLEDLANLAALSSREETSKIMNGFRSAAIDTKGRVKGMSDTYQKAKLTNGAMINSNIEVVADVIVGLHINYYISPGDVLSYMVRNKVKEYYFTMNWMPKLLVANVDKCSVTKHVGVKRPDGKTQFSYLGDVSNGYVSDTKTYLDWMLLPSEPVLMGHSEHNFYFEIIYSVGCMVVGKISCSKSVRSRGDEGADRSPFFEEVVMIGPSVRSDDSARREITAVGLKEEVVSNMLNKCGRYKELSEAELYQRIKAIVEVYRRTIQVNGDVISDEGLDALGASETQVVTEFLYRYVMASRNGGGTRAYTRDIPPVNYLWATLGFLTFAITVPENSDPLGSVLQSAGSGLGNLALWLRRIVVCAKEGALAGCDVARRAYTEMRYGRVEPSRSMVIQAYLEIINPFSEAGYEAAQAESRVTGFARALGGSLIHRMDLVDGLVDTGMKVYTLEEADRIMPMGGSAENFGPLWTYLLTRRGLVKTLSVAAPVATVAYTVKLLGGAVIHRLFGVLRSGAADNEVAYYSNVINPRYWSYHWIRCGAFVTGGLVAAVAKSTIGLSSTLVTSVTLGMVVSGCQVVSSWSRKVMQDRRVGTPHSMTFGGWLAYQIASRVPATRDPFRRHSLRTDPRTSTIILAECVTNHEAVDNFPAIKSPRVSVNDLRKLLEFPEEFSPSAEVSASEVRLDEDVEHALARSLDRLQRYLKVVESKAGSDLDGDSVFAALKQEVLAYHESEEIRELNAVKRKSEYARALKEIRDSEGDVTPGVSGNNSEGESNEKKSKDKPTAGGTRAKRGSESSDNDKRGEPSKKNKDKKKDKRGEPSKKDKGANRKDDGLDGRTDNSGKSESSSDDSDGDDADDAPQKYRVTIQRHTNGKATTKATKQVQGDETASSSSTDSEDERRWGRRNNFTQTAETGFARRTNAKLVFMFEGPFDGCDQFRRIMEYLGTNASRRGESQLFQSRTDDHDIYVLPVWMLEPPVEFNDDMPVVYPNPQPDVVEEEGGSESDEGMFEGESNLSDVLLPPIEEARPNTPQSLNIETGHYIGAEEAAALSPMSHQDTRPWRLGGGIIRRSVTNLIYDESQRRLFVPGDLDISCIPPTVEGYPVTTVTEEDFLGGRTILPVRGDGNCFYHMITLYLAERDSDHQMSAHDLRQMLAVGAADMIDWHTELDYTTFTDCPDRETYIAVNSQNQRMSDAVVVSLVAWWLKVPIATHVERDGVSQYDIFCDDGWNQSYFFRLKNSHWELVKSSAITPLPERQLRLLDLDLINLLKDVDRHTTRKDWGGGGKPKSQNPRLNSAHEDSPSDPLAVVDESDQGVSVNAVGMLQEALIANGVDHRIEYALDISPDGQKLVTVRVGEYRESGVGSNYPTAKQKAAYKMLKVITAELMKGKVREEPLGSARRKKDVDSVLLPSTTGDATFEDQFKMMTLTNCDGATGGVMVHPNPVGHLYELVASERLGELRYRHWETSRSNYQALFILGKLYSSSVGQLVKKVKRAAAHKMLSELLKLDAAGRKTLVATARSDEEINLLVDGELRKRAYYGAVGTSQSPVGPGGYFGGRMRGAGPLTNKPYVPPRDRKPKEDSRLSFKLANTTYFKEYVGGKPSGLPTLPILENFHKDSKVQYLASAMHIYSKYVKKGQSYYLLLPPEELLKGGGRYLVSLQGSTVLTTEKLLPSFKLKYRVFEDFNKLEIFVNQLSVDSCVFLYRPTKHSGGSPNSLLQLVKNRFSEAFVLSPEFEPGMSSVIAVPCGKLYLSSNAVLTPVSLDPSRLCPHCHNLMEFTRPAVFHRVFRNNLCPRASTLVAGDLDDVSSAMTKKELRKIREKERLKGLEDSSEPMVMLASDLISQPKMDSRLAEVTREMIALKCVQHISLLCPKRTWSDSTEGKKFYPSPVVMNVVCDDPGAIMEPMADYFVENAALLYLKVEEAQSQAGLSGNIFKKPKDLASCTEFVFMRDRVLSRSEFALGLSQGNVKSNWAVMIGKEEEYSFSFHYLRAARQRVNVEYRPSLKSMYLVDGMAGCGKTQKIVDLVKRLGEKNVIVVTQSLGGMLELHERGVHSARTMASYLVNYTKYTGWTPYLIIDEACMMHAGAITELVVITNASYVIMFGDSKQINDLDELSVPWAKSALPIMPYVVKNTHTYRCPLDAARIISGAYGGTVTTSNKIRNSVTFKYDITPTDLKQFDNEKYFIYTMTNAELAWLKTHFKYAKCNTIHRFQGLSTKHTVFVRYNPKKMNIYELPNGVEKHSLVAFSRHTESMVYMSCLPRSSDTFGTQMEGYMATGSATYSNEDAGFARFMDSLEKLEQVKGEWLKVAPFYSVRQPNPGAWNSILLAMDEVSKVRVTRESDKFGYMMAGGKAVGFTVKKDAASVKILAELANHPPIDLFSTESLDRYSVRSAVVDRREYLTVYYQPGMKVTVGFAAVLNLDGTDCWYKTTSHLWKRLGVTDVKGAYRKLGVPMGTCPVLQHVFAKLGELMSKVVSDAPCTPEYSNHIRVGRVNGKLTCPGCRYFVMERTDIVSHVSVSLVPTDWRVCGNVSEGMDLIVGGRTKSGLEVVSGYDFLCHAGSDASIFTVLAQTHIPKCTWIAEEVPVEVGIKNLEEDRKKLLIQMDTNSMVGCSEPTITDMFIPKRVQYSKLEPGKPVGDVSSVLQDVYYQMYPELEITDVEHDYERALTTGVTMDTQSARFSVQAAFDAARWDFKLRRRNPANFRTNYYPNQDNSFKSLVAAANKRNFNPPVQRGPGSSETFTKRYIPIFAAAYMKTDWYKLSEYYKKNPVGVNEAYMSQWVAKLPGPKVKKHTKADNHLFEIRGFHYSCSLKTQNKTTGESSITKSTPRGQVINSSPEEITSQYSYIFKELLDRFKSLLKPSVLMAIGYDPDHINGYLNHFLKPSESYENIVVDFSAFDKSIDKQDFSFFMAMMDLVGMPAHMLKFWEQTHAYAKSKSTVGLSFFVDYQTKSGDAATAFMNTVVSMLAMSTVYLTVEPKVAMFLGDDSLMMTTNKGLIDSSINSFIAKEFNITAKYASSGPSEFCGGFVVTDGSKYKFMSDPVKRVEKLGCQDNPEILVLLSRFLSFGDRTRDYDNEEFNRALADAVRLRYNTDADIETMIAALYHLGTDPHTYLGIYGIEINDVELELRMTQARKKMGDDAPWLESDRRGQIQRIQELRAMLRRQIQEEKECTVRPRGKLYCAILPPMCGKSSITKRFPDMYVDPDKIIGGELGWGVPIIMPGAIEMFDRSKWKKKREIAFFKMGRISKSHILLLHKRAQFEAIKKYQPDAELFAHLALPKQTIEVKDIQNADNGYNKLRLLYSRTLTWQLPEYGRLLAPDEDVHKVLTEEFSKYLKEHPDELKCYHTQSIYRTMGLGEISTSTTSLGKTFKDRL